MLKLTPYTFGIGDRFAHQAKAQLAAFVRLKEQGQLVVPVWNKSNREHNFVGSEPASVREAALKAIEELDWKDPWHIDADHIQLQTVDRFLEVSDFFTLDVADAIGAKVPAEEIQAFVDQHTELQGKLNVPGIDEPLELTRDFVEQVVNHYLQAARQAGAIYQHILNEKKGVPFAVEVSMDETDNAQTPKELLVILAALADQGIPIQTIAPKFTGRFNKGVDYVGDLAGFEKEFRDDLAVLQYASKTYGLPENLKLSVHSGSDKFSLYPIIRSVLRESGAGIHLKTAGTTWLEEIIGLAEAGGEALTLAKEFYYEALSQVDELCAPYASVIDISESRLPTRQAVESWDGSQFASAVRHIPTNPAFNPDMRQLLHVSFKLAAKAGKRYTDLLVAHEAVVSEHVTTNLYERHLKPLFLD